VTAEALHVTIHSLAEALAAAGVAAEAGVRLVLWSAPGAGTYAGPGWFAEIVARVEAEFSALPVEAVLDCGAEAGSVMGALRRGVKRVRFTGEAEAAQRLADIARQYGAALEPEREEPMLDLRGHKDPAAACRAFLARNAPRG
jgi:hypothetical protein